jgi:hypothetical protein
MLSVLDYRQDPEMEDYRVDVKENHCQAPLI